MGDPINDKLIELIRDRPCLYDLNHSDSNSFQVKEKQWCEISKKLRIDATFLKKRWKVIRDRFRKEWNTINNDPYSEGKSLWRHYKQVGFLEPHMRPRPYIPKFEPVETLQPKFVPNEFDDFSEYLEVLESEPEEEPNEEPQPQTFLQHSRLIAAVRTKPILYDPRNYKYNCRHQKQIAWEQVAKEMNATVDSVKHKWQELRDRFRREFTKPNNNGEVSSFEYYDQLSFLDDTFDHNPSSSCELESEIVFCNDLSDENEVIEEGDNAYKYLKEEEETVSSEINTWFNLDDRDCKMAQFMRNNPILYDIHHPNFKDKPMRNRKWAQLSLETGQDIYNLKARWQTIQERYRMYNPTDLTDSNSKKFIAMLAFIDQNPDSESVSNRNIKHEVESVNCAVPRTSSPSYSYHSPTTTYQDSVTQSHVKMFFDSIAAQIEAENLPFRHFSIIQQEVLKIVHQQISSYLEDQQ